VNPLKRNLEAVFIFRAERRKEMTSLVQSSSLCTLGDDELSLSDRIRLDIEHAQRPQLFRKEREQWFFILDAGADLPEELTQREYRDIHPSAAQLPATTESLVKLEHVFRVLNNNCRFGIPEIRDCTKEGVIFYSIETRTEPRRH
jgi:hypothetical protein